MELWDSFDKRLLRWVAKFSQLKGRSCGCGEQLKRWGDSGRGRERGWWLKSGERELDGKGFKERSLGRVRMWGQCCAWRARGLLSRLGWIRAVV